MLKCKHRKHPRSQGIRFYVREHQNTHPVDELPPSPAKLSELKIAILAALAVKNKDSVACDICNRPVSLEDASIDEDGRAVHSVCYLKRILD